MNSLVHFPLRKNQNPSKYYNSITNLKFQHKPKISSFKNPHIKNRPINPKSLELIYSMMNLNTISLPWQARRTNYLDSQIDIPQGFRFSNMCNWLWCIIKCYFKFVTRKEKPWFPCSTFDSANSTCDVDIGAETYSCSGKHQPHSGTCIDRI